jgi:hypothetical protein
MMREKFPLASSVFVHPLPEMLDSRIQSSMSPLLKSTWHRLFFPILIGALSGTLFIPPLSMGFPQSAKLREKLHGVQSRQVFASPLRSRARLRFSPDGKFILLQDLAGVFVISRELFRAVGHVDAVDLYGAIFSADSQFLRVVGPSLIAASWKLPGFQNPSGIDLPLKDGCLDGQVSSTSEVLACYRPDESLQIFDLKTGAELFSEPPHRDPTLKTRVLLPLDSDTPYAGPIGFVVVDSFAQFADRHILRVPMFFSPDGHDLLVTPNVGSSIRIDIPNKRKTPIHGSFSKHKFTVLALLEANRVLATDPDNKDALQILSLETGDRVGSLPIRAETARLATNSRFLLWRESNDQSVRVFDLQENRVLDSPLNIGLDISGNDLAFYDESGVLSLSHLNDPAPYRRATIPLSNLPALHVASVDPNLKRIAFSAGDMGGVFQVESGKQIVSLRTFISASFGDPFSAWITVPRNGQVPAQIEKLDTSTGKIAPVAPIGKTQLRSNGVVMTEYAFDDPGGFDRPLVTRLGGVRFRLRGLDSATGFELWKHSFLQETPIPFPDPQGDRLVLGWNARDDGAHEAAGHFPATKQILKKAKLKDQDTFFEILDARSGKSLGGVLVQAGSGPSSFDTAFSCGDSLILVKDARRVSIYSLSDGGLRAHLIGEKPVANSNRNLLALDAGTGRLAIYDLRSGAKLDDQLFPSDISFMQFSGDGKSLLVLTSQQEVFVLSTDHPPVIPTPTVPLAP